MKRPSEVIRRLLPWLIFFAASVLLTLMLSFSTPWNDSMKCPTPMERFKNPGFTSVFQDLESNHSDFNVALGMSSDQCNSFVLSITRTNSTQCAELLSLDAARDFGEIGPDSFRVQTDGAERWGSETHQYEGGCSYRFDVVLANGGPVTLQIYHTYERYGSFPSRDTVLNTIYQPLFPKILELPRCSRQCAEYRSHSKQASRRSTDVKACDSRKGVKGSYIPLHHEEYLRPPLLPLWSDSYPLGGIYAFVPEGCNWSSDGLRFHSREKCLAPGAAIRNILFVGDSHSRCIFDAMTKRLSGDDEPAPDSSKVPSKGFFAGSLNATFVWDPRAHWLKNLTCDQIEPYESITISVGTWLATTMDPPGKGAPLDTPEFLNEMELITSHLSELAQTCGQRAPLLLYINAPAVPPLVGENIPDWDRRSNPKFSLWNDAIESLLQDTAWKTIDFYSLTIGFSEDPLHIDKVHYFTSIAMESVVDEVIHKLDLCGG